ncbi:hypothetical protein [Sinorhizobium meliloti]|uniref:hypothetical protein n=1 Tax=Rhizobium meliloti TaxID=382 RepID=UPI0002E76849|nr:hypothetical protein [Sinorhizobium meliloti]
MDLPERRRGIGFGTSTSEATGTLDLGHWASGSSATEVGACGGGAGFKPDDAGR